jgi:hypothetical protein
VRNNQGRALDFVDLEAFGEGAFDIVAVLRSDQLKRQPPPLCARILSGQLLTLGTARRSAAVAFDFLDPLTEFLARPPFLLGELEPTLLRGRLEAGDLDVAGERKGLSAPRGLHGSADPGDAHEITWVVASLVDDCRVFLSKCLLAEVDRVADPPLHPSV